MASRAADPGLATPDGVGVDRGLFLLGLGWSFGNVAASALIVNEVPSAIRAQAQGGLDTLGNIGSAAAAVAGPIMVAAQYSGLALVSGLCLVPIAVVCVRALRVNDEPLA